MVAWVTISLIPLVGCPDLHIFESGRSRAVPSTHGLHRLAFAAVRRAPKRPLVAGADGFHGVPELGGNPGVPRVFEHASQLAVLDLPANLATELEVVALVIDGPRAVGLHVDAVVDSGDELIEGQRFLARHNADVGHAD